MPKYACSHGVTIVAADTSIALIQPAAALRRGYMYDLIVSCGQAPADAASVFKVAAFTGATAGTGDGVDTPVNLDGADAAADLDYNHTYTVEPTTYTADADYLVFGLNQRGLFRWVAAPGGALVVPTTNNAGIGVHCVSTSAASTYEFTIHYEE